MLYRGDYGTYERAEKAMMISDQQLDFLPCIGGFHLQMTWAQMIMNKFYDTESATDSDGLYAIKVILNSNQVKEDVRKNYYAASLFLDKVLDSYLLKAAREDLPDKADDDTARSAAMKVSEKLFQENHTAIPETTTCSVCKKKCGSYAGLSKHINRLHAELSEDVDSVQGYTRQLNKLLLIKRIMDVAIKYGDGATLSLIMKFMIPYFKASGHNKYALACFEHVAQTKFFLSPRMKELVIHECFVNNKGNANSNMAMDLAIEHCNKFFKDNFTLKDSTPSQAVLKLRKASVNMVELLDMAEFKAWMVDKYETMEDRCFLPQ